ncbi:far upstream element-binding protein 1 isoform X1 [Diabrotica undecimpunctata]|uniref:far upstream element-binding protein 1 isoform X1 n=1 Tax=Diabrotica undecimpunctata TaxID=50387 RepID=UPI003B637AEB
MSDYSAVAPPPQNFNQSTAFAAAVQRAKQIAAKINPGTTGNDSRPKRPLEEAADEFDVEPDAKKGPASLVSSQNQAPPNMGRPPQNQGMGGGGGGPPGMQQVSEDIKVPDKMVGLIIGRGGEQITRLQSETGCKIQMAPDSQGMSDRICSLSGPKDAVERAKQLISDIIRQRGGPPGVSDDEMSYQNNHSDFQGVTSIGGPGGPGGGPGPGQGQGGRNSIEIMIPGPKVGLIIGKGGETIKQLQEKSGAKMVVIQDGPNQEHEKPLVISGDPQKVEHAKQLVYDLIAEKEMKGFNRGGPRGRQNQGPNDGGYNDYGGGGGGEQMEVLVPRPAVGVVIGKGGDMIKKIQAETGAKVQFQQARDEGPGDRRCYLSGNPKQVEMARQRIDELIDSVLQRDGDGGGMGAPMGGGMRGGRGGGRGGRGGHHGGRGGGQGGFDRGDRNGGGGDFGGGNQWEDRRGGGGPGGLQGGGQQDVVSFTVPANKCGVIIGRGGETIKQINQQSGAYCELDRRAQNQNPTANEKVFNIKGDPDSIETAKRIIQEKVQMPLNFVSQSGGGGPPMNTSMPTAYPGMAPQNYNPQNSWGMQGGGGGGVGGAGGYQQQQQWGGQPQGADSQSGQPNKVQVNPSTGQPDYSMQWAEYYRSLGMHREAEMIEQQAKAKATGSSMQTAPAPAQPAAPAQSANPSSQADYSAQWAEYYRSMGKHKEAEAIEAQMKNKGPMPGAAGGAATGQTPAAPGTQPGGYSQAQAPYGGYQPQAAAGGYYGGQPQTAPVPGGVPQGGYGFPSYGYGGQQQQPPQSQE